MLKMIICMDEDKINLEQKYPLDRIYHTINNVFAKMELPRLEDGSGSLVYRDTGRSVDYGKFGRIVNSLKKQPWFMENVAVWTFCDSDDSEDPNDFNEEDLLHHYRQTQPIGGFHWSENTLKL